MSFLTLTMTITIVGLVGCIIFVLGYWIASKGAWKDTDAGRFIMFFQATLATLFALIISTRLWGDWHGRRNVTTVLYALYAAEAWWPIRLLWNAVKNRRKERHEQKVLARHSGENS